MVKRVSTGFSGLDRILEGGFPEDTINLIVGAAGTGKTILSRKFIASSLLRKQKCIYVITGESPDVAYRALRDMDKRIENYKENLIIIDAYSWKIGKTPKGYGINSLDLTDLMITIKSAITEKDFEQGIFVLDSITDFLLSIRADIVLLFLRSLTATIKHYNSIGLLILDEPFQESQLISSLNYITDGTIELKTEGSRRMLKIHRMAATSHPIAWYEYEITKELEMRITKPIQR